MKEESMAEAVVLTAGEAVEVVEIGALWHGKLLLAQRLQGRESSHRVRARRHWRQASAVRDRLAERRAFCRSSLDGATGWFVSRNSARP